MPMGRLWFDPFLPPIRIARFPSRNGLLNCDLGELLLLLLELRYELLEVRYLLVLLVEGWYSYKRLSRATISRFGCYSVAMNLDDREPERKNWVHTKLRCGLIKLACS